MTLRLASRSHPRSTRMTNRSTPRSPNPSDIFAFIDEHEQSIDDAAMIVDNRLGNTHGQWINDWIDLPADRHNQGCSISFTDGHVVYWRWKWPKRFKAHAQPAASASQDPQQNDLRELRQ